VRAPPPPATPAVDLNWFDFNILFNSRTLPLTRNRNGDGDKLYMRKTIRSNLVEQYIAMICGHANDIRQAAVPDDQRLDNNGEKIVSCKWLSSLDFEAIRSEFARSISKRATVLFNVKRSLESINLTRENFQTLDYLFIPVLQKADEHYVLFGLGKNSI
jgi:hypothetical protein